MTRIPFVDLAGLLKPDIPVASIGFMRYSRCDSHDLESITDKYHRTLEKFVCLLSEAEGVDYELVKMAVKCQKLTYLVFHGLIQHNTIVALAQERGKDWFNLEFMEENITTDSHPIGEMEEGEKQIVGQRESGNNINFILKRETT